MGRGTLSRKVMFQCLHRYEVANWSPEKNKSTFGACYTQTNHGHNYELVGFFSGPIDDETGMILNLKDADEILKTAVSHLDGKFLNQDVEEFKSIVPTTENIAKFLSAKILADLSNFDTVVLTRLRLYETESLWVDWINESN